MSLAALPLGVVVALFAAAAAVVLVCGMRLTEVADRFADRSGIGEAVTGAVFLGALTSLSGSVTSITAAAQGHPDLALANAIGGIAAQTAFLMIADVAYRRANLEHAAASLPNIVSGVTLVALLAVVLMTHALPEVTFLAVHPTSLLLGVIYVAGVRIAAEATRAPMWEAEETPETRPDLPEEPRGDRRSVARLLAAIAALGLAVAVAGFVIAETGLEIAARTGLREGLVGAVLTAVVTSTPELVTTLSAVNRGALTLAVGGIIGGNTFDVLFAAFSDVAYREGSIYHAMAPDQLFLTQLVILMTAVLLIGLLQRERYGPGNIGYESVVLLGLYVGGLVALFFAY